MLLMLLGPVQLLVCGRREYPLNPFTSKFEPSSELTLNHFHLLTSRGGTGGEHRFRSILHPAQSVTFEWFPVETCLATATTHIATSSHDKEHILCVFGPFVERRQWQVGRRQNTFILLNLFDQYETPCLTCGVSECEDHILTGGRRCGTANHSLNAIAPYLKWVEK